MRPTLKQVLFGATVAVVASTGFLPLVSGYGTHLGQGVELGSWALVAHSVSSGFADRHDGVVWTVAALLNGLLFFVPGWAIYAVTRRRRPRLGAGLLVVWWLFYLASLFWLFPALDGP
jgi:hypothetical protein